MKGLVPKNNLAEWYTQVVLRAELADYAPIRGCMVIRPYGFAIWEKIRDFLDQKFKKSGHKNAYFPIFIPETFLKREKEHIQGFAPQCAWVTRGGDEELEEELALRPTSEAIICSMFAKWVQSYRDLPVLLNQWANVIRWEKSTRLFLRTTEFLWQEGHTLHQTEKEAEEEALRILDIYEELFNDFLAIPVIKGIKPASEKFAGAEKTYTLEALMPDGQALQAGTSHNLGQNFSRAFNIKYLDEENQMKFPYGTSWGVSTRIIGALIMTHGDDRGLILPPSVAPIKVVIVPIWTKSEAVNEKLTKKGRELSSLIKNFIGSEVEFDERREETPGWKFAEWELRGVPLRIEIGERELNEKKVSLVRRGESKREELKEDALAKIPLILNETQISLRTKAKDFLTQRRTFAETIPQFQKVLSERPGFVCVYWCGRKECEDKIKEETKTTPRVMPLNQEKKIGKCLICQKETKEIVYYARAY